MRVGFQGSVVQGRRTGINNYAYEILASLTRLDAELELLGSTVLGCQRFTPSPRPASSTASPSSSTKFLNPIWKRAKRLTPVRAFKRNLTAASIALTYLRCPVDLFHAFNYVPPGNVRAPVLPVVYDLSFIRFPHLHPAERVRSLASLPQIVSEAPFVHTISEFSKRELIEVLGCIPSKIFVAPPAAAEIYAPLSAPETTSQLKQFGLSANEFFLSVGTIEPRKNLRTIVEAYSELTRSQREKCPLVVVGGEGWGELDFPSGTDGLVREGSLRFLGYVSDSELRVLYCGARLMLFPSLYEGFGMPVVEAMACGAPVAHSAATSMDEIGGTYALRISAQDVDAWAGCLRDSLDDNGALDPAFRAMRTEHARSFNWLDSAQKVLDYYYRLSELL